MPDRFQIFAESGQDGLWDFLVLGITDGEVRDRHELHRNLVDGLDLVGDLLELAEAPAGSVRARVAELKVRRVEMMGGSPL